MLERPSGDEQESQPSDVLSKEFSLRGNRIRVESTQALLRASVLQLASQQGVNIEATQKILDRTRFTLEDPENPEDLAVLSLHEDNTYTCAIGVKRILSLFSDRQESPLATERAAEAVDKIVRHESQHILQKTDPHNGEYLRRRFARNMKIRRTVARIGLVATVAYIGGAVGDFVNILRENSLDTKNIGFLLAAIPLYMLLKYQLKGLPYHLYYFDRAEREARGAQRRPRVPQSYPFTLTIIPITSSEEGIS